MRGRYYVQTLGAARRLPPDLSGPEADYLLSQLSDFIYSMTGERPDPWSRSRQGLAEAIAYDLGYQKSFADRESYLTPLFFAWNENRRLPANLRYAKGAIEDSYTQGTVDGRNERERLRATRRR